MDGVTIAGRMLRNPTLSVKSEPAGITISCADERDPTQWVMVYITTAALWQLVNLQDGGGEFMIPPVPPLEDIDLGNPPVPLFPLVPPVPPLDALPPIPPPPRKG